MASEGLCPECLRDPLAKTDSVPDRFGGMPETGDRFECDSCGTELVVFFVPTTDSNLQGFNISAKTLERVMAMGPSPRTKAARGRTQGGKTSPETRSRALGPRRKSRGR